MPRWQGTSEVAQSDDFQLSRPLQPRFPTGFQAASLGSKLEIATGEDRPVQALLVFSKALSGPPKPASVNHFRSNSAASRRFETDRLSPLRATRSGHNVGGLPFFQEWGGSADWCVAEARPFSVLAFSSTSPPTNVQLPLAPPKSQSRCLFRRDRWAPGRCDSAASALANLLQQAKRTSALSPSVRAYGPEPEDDYSSLEDSSTDDVEEDLPEITITVEENAEHVPAVQSSVGSSRKNTNESIFPEEPEVPIPWSMEDLGAVFKQFRNPSDSEVQVDSLFFVLRYLGCRPCNEDIHDIAESLTCFSSLDWLEFVQFVQNYRKRDLQNLRALFDAADSDGNGVLDVTEIETVLKEFGYSPSVEATREAFKAIDIDGNGAVDFNEFEQVQGYLRDTRGFVKEELDTFRALYDRIAVDDKISKNHVWKMLNYLCYQIRIDVLENAFRTVLILKDGDRISYDELLKTLSEVRDLERELIRDKMMLLRKQGQNVGPKVARRTSSLRGPGPNQRKASALSIITVTRGTTTNTEVELSSFGHFLASMQYFCSQELINEILNDHMSKLEKENVINVDEVEVFLRCYRSVDGLTKKHAERVEEIFYFEQKQLARRSYVDVDGPDECASKVVNAASAADLRSSFRRLGLNKTVQQISHALEEVRVSTGSIDVDMFRKMFSRMLRTEARDRRTAFEMFADSSEIPKLLECKVKEVIKLFSKCDSVAELLEQAGVRNTIKELTWMDFEEAIARYNQLYLRFQRENHSFNTTMIEKLRGIWARYDTDKKGWLRPPELRLMLQQIVPEATVNSQFGRKDDIIALLPRGRENTFTFSRFLELMRLVLDLREDIDIRQEPDVLSRCGYTDAEVQGLRSLFVTHLNAMEELEFGNLLQLLEQLFPISNGAQQEIMHNIFLALRVNGSAVLRFPQFLIFMQEITQQNVFGVNDKMKELLGQQEMKNVKALPGRFNRRGTPPRLYAVKTVLKEIEEDKESEENSSLTPWGKSFTC